MSAILKSLKDRRDLIHDKIHDLEDQLHEIQHEIDAVETELNPPGDVAIALGKIFDDRFVKLFAEKTTQEV